MLDFVTLVALAAAGVSIGGAVFSVLFARRGADAELKTDLNELALLVERMAKAQRREKMARVRAASREAESPNETIPLDFQVNPKAALRARLAAKRG